MPQYTHRYRQTDPVRYRRASHAIKGGCSCRAACWQTATCQVSNRAVVLLLGCSGHPLCRKHMPVEVTSHSRISAPIVSAPVSCLRGSWPPGKGGGRFGVDLISVQCPSPNPTTRSGCGLFHVLPICHSRKSLFCLGPEQMPPTCFDLAP